jgi:hypothetical protein
MTNSRAETTAVLIQAVPGRYLSHFFSSIPTMESLRTKASTRRGPKPVAKLSKPAKNARKSRVDDKIKRRMSTRYAAISAPTPTDSTPPSLPTIPVSLRGPGLEIIREKDEVVQQQPLSREDLRAAENKLLDVEDFDPDACMRFFSPSILLFHAESGLRSKAETCQFYRS